MKKILAVLGAMVLSASVGMYYSFSYTEKTLRNNDYIRDQISETIAIVSLDDGVDVNGVREYYANDFINLLGNDAGYVVESASGASAGLADGKYGAIITFPSNTSECILSLNSATPVSLPITYTINSKLDSQSYINVASKIGDFQNDINDQVSYMYVSSILSELHGAQDQAGQLLDNNEEILVLLDDLELMDYVESLELGGIPTLDFQPEGLNIEGYMNEANRCANDISGYYLSSYQQALRDYIEMTQELAISSETLRSNASLYFDELNSWRDASIEQNTRVFNYNTVLLNYYTELSGFRSDLEDEIDEFNTNVNSFNSWYSSVNRWYYQLNSYSVGCGESGEEFEASSGDALAAAEALNAENQANLEALEDYRAALEEYYGSIVEFNTSFESYNTALGNLDSAINNLNTAVDRVHSCLFANDDDPQSSNTGNQNSNTNTNTDTDNNVAPVDAQNDNNNNEQANDQDTTNTNNQSDPDSTNVNDETDNENSVDNSQDAQPDQSSDNNVGSGCDSTPQADGGCNSGSSAEPIVPSSNNTQNDAMYGELGDAIAQLKTAVEDYNAVRRDYNTARNNLTTAINNLNGLHENLPETVELSDLASTEFSESVATMNSAWDTYSDVYSHGVPAYTNPYQAVNGEYTLDMEVPVLEPLETGYELQPIPLMDNTLYSDMDQFLRVSGTYNPLSYLSTDVDELITARIARFSDYSYGIENTMNASYENNINRMRSSLNTYTSYVNNMRSTAVNTYNAEQEAFQASVTAYGDSVRAINDNNAELIGSFSTVMPNSRSGADVNTNVVNAIIQPVVFDNQSDLMTAEVTSFNKATKPLKYVMIGSGAFAAVFAAWSAVDAIRKKRV